VNVTVENLSACKKLVRVEVEAGKVDETLAAQSRLFQRKANLPGFRPGKVPPSMISRLYEKEIASEAQNRLISESLQEVLKEHKLELVTRPDVAEIQFGAGQPLHYAATVETAPQFELPEYKGLPAQIPVRTVTDADVEQALQALRERQVKHVTVDRPAQLGDMAVVNYEGTCEDKPIVQLAPTARGLTAQKNFWVEVGGTGFIPGFGEQLQTAKAGEKRTVTVDFPADFVTPQLAGKRGVYQVEVVEVKEKVLPALDEELAKSYGAADLTVLREGVRKDLENELVFARSRSIRNQVVGELLKRLQFDVPESTLEAETKRIVQDMVQNGAKKGVPKEAIEEQKDKILESASQAAKERVRSNFIFRKIAQREEIKVEREEVGRYVSYLAQSSQVPVDKLIKDIEKREGWGAIVDQVMNEKVVAFLESNAKIEEIQIAPAGAAPAAPAAPAPAAT